MTKAASETTIDTTAKVADGGLTDRPAVHHTGRPSVRRGRVGGRATRSSATPPLPPSSSARSSSRSTWSQNATNIVAQKYFRGPLGSPERERSVRQMIGRVAGTIAGWGREGGYFATPADADAFEAELDPHPPAPEGRLQLARSGSTSASRSTRSARPASSSASRTRWSRSSPGTPRRAQIFRGGSGSGINLSNIRGSTEQLSKGGYASGPVSFMRGADAWAGTIKSGGKTRRAAKMVVLDVDHPDIEDFIWCKAKEEDKAAALRDAGFDMSIDGEGFTSIQYQNANNSVRDHRRVHGGRRGRLRLGPDRPQGRRRR